ncbi:MAG TPA: methionine adenosyltransferase [Alphaproteobacteria bacterium]
MRYIFTSESVSEGHPDKICDQISDAILDAYLTQDPEHRVALETTATTNFVLLAGETKGRSNLTVDDLKQITRDTVKRIGYEQDEFHWNKIEIDCRVHAQSADIAQGVDATGSKEEGAGDQGIMFGYACKETPELMPAAIMYAHQILKSLSDDRHKGVLSMLGPDAKSQVSLVYENGKPVGVHSVVLSTQHIPGLSQDDVKQIVRPYVERVLPQGWMCEDKYFYVNPTGQFIIGGPDGDTGLTGRKIIVDTYGGAAPHGGGAFSGKDPTKVDRSAAYAARYLAKNIVAADLADKCTVQLSYAIGVAHPISVYLETHGTSKVDTERLSKIMQELVDLSPKGIRTHLQLNKPIYSRTAAYGHFGRAPDADGGFSWEKTDLVDALKRAF